MINYANKKVEFNGCSGCAYANHEFILPCGMAYENDKFTLSQDWELPIEGFFVVSPKRCVEKFADLTEEERVEIFDITHKTINILRENNICDRFNMVFEEKENRHFHIWIMPRHKWMTELVGDIIDHIGEIFEYAKENFRNEETYKRIEEITNIVRKNLIVGE
jgi:diadenosine tetraphosphate (Ap4A) HIT family hydrolase